MKKKWLAALLAALAAALGVYTSPEAERLLAGALASPLPVGAAALRP